MTPPHEKAGLSQRSQGHPEDHRAASWPDPGTVSAALNNSPAARSIPEHTKNRIIEAAKRSITGQFFCPHPAPETHLHHCVIAEEIGDAYGSMVISGIEEYLRKNDYFFLT